MRYCLFISQCRSGMANRSYSYVRYMYITKPYVYQALLFAWLIIKKIYSCFVIEEKGSTEKDCG